MALVVRPCGADVVAWVMASGAGPPAEDEDVSACLGGKGLMRGASDRVLLRPCCSDRTVMQVVDSVIRRSGCEDKYRAMEDCLAFKTNRDFKACTQVCSWRVFVCVLLCCLRIQICCLRERPPVGEIDVRARR